MTAAAETLDRQLAAAGLTVTAEEIIRRSEAAVRAEMAAAIRGFFGATVPA